MNLIRLSDNIVCPLGHDTQTTLEAILQGKSGLRLHTDWNHLPEPVCASLFEPDEIESAFAESCQEKAAYTRFERLIIATADRAVRQAGLDATSPRVLFVLSTTKGNVALLDRNAAPVHPDAVLPFWSALRLAEYFGNPNTPLVVSNACISGLSAQIVAMRALQSGRYDTAVITGADVQSPFIVSGFQSFKALSQQPCQPFDRQRHGLNLGEGAATLILQNAATPQGAWTLCRGAIRNDSNHISGPSRTGEGAYRALKATLSGEDTDQLAMVSVHGTATPYNDEMEAVALQRAGLASLPVNAYKGYLGHTMGAAGVLEAVLSMHALDRGVIPATHGFSELGVSVPLQVSNQALATSKKAFVKMLSGFGGCNAALLYRKGGDR